MNIVIPMNGQVSMVICSSFVSAKYNGNDRYSLSGDNFQMVDVTKDKVFIFPDDVIVTEGQVLTDAVIAMALPFESFLTVSAEEAIPYALGLLLREAVADGRITDAELLSIQPALEGRAWQVGLSVFVGDVYTYSGCLWRCIQSHTAQQNWTPDMLPALWRKVEVIHEDAVRVWAAGIDYVTSDEVAYPDADGNLFVCQMAHTSQAGWEPPNAPALWQAKTAAEDDAGTDTGLADTNSAQQQDATEA
ncbi:MAG: hypothetical protein IJ313_09515 [Clostridia bacterium]|nr:hypothetical protein [Clostridia bacterium]